MGQERAKELEEACERDLRLGLDPARSDDRHVVGGRRGVLEQRRLSDSGLSAKHEDTARTAPCAVDQLVDLLSLPVPPDEHVVKRTPSRTTSNQRGCVPYTLLIHDNESRWSALGSCAVAAIEKYDPISPEPRANMKLVAERPRRQSASAKTVTAVAREEHYVETPHGRVYVEVEGEPAAELVMLATGGPGVSHDHYHPWFTRLLPEFRVAYVDYIGCGRADRLADANGYSVALLAESLEAVLRHLGAATCSLVGISFGGFPAVESALSRPAAVRRLVLSNAQVSAAAWQRTNIDGVNGELARSSPPNGARSSTCGRRVCARSTPVTKGCSSSFFPTSNGSIPGIIGL